MSAGLDFEPPQDLIELGAEEDAQPPLDDRDVVRMGLEPVQISKPRVPSMQGGAGFVPGVAEEACR